jgi:hypothetical protein
MVRENRRITVDDIALRGRRFSSDEQVIGAMQNWLKTQQKKKNFFPDGIKKEILGNAGTAVR